MLDLEVLHSRDALISAVERLADKGSFAVTIGKAALIADPDNLKNPSNCIPAILYYKTEANKMNATIIYLKDGINFTIEVVVELIGEPQQSFMLSQEVIEMLAERQQTVFCDNEFSADSPTQTLQ